MVGAFVPELYLSLILTVQHFFFLFLIMIENEESNPVLNQQPEWRAYITFFTLTFHPEAEGLICLTGASLWSCTLPLCCRYSVMDSGIDSTPLLRDHWVHDSLIDLWARLPMGTEDLEPASFKTFTKRLSIILWGKNWYFCVGERI